MADEKAPYVHKEFPKWKYRGNESQQVNDAVAEEELGSEWGDTPGYTAANPAPAPKEFLIYN